MMKTLLIFTMVAAGIAYAAYDPGLACRPGNSLAENVAIKDQIERDLIPSLQRLMNFTARAHAAARDADLEAVKEQLALATSQHDLARPLSDSFNDCSRIIYTQRKAEP